MAVTDIFIKTYKGDFVWLEYLLASIQKFASGFRHVVIICDGNDGQMIPHRFLFPGCKVRYVPLPKLAPPKVTTGIGYLWQQAIKLKWWTYTDADAVLVLDSDWMLTTKTTPEDFQHEGQWYWCYRDWEKAGTAISWKEPVESLTQLKANYEAMCISGFILERETCIAFKDYLCNLYQQHDIWDVFVTQRIHTASEFNMLGTYIYHCRDNYCKLVNPDYETLHNSTIRASWSWGGLQDEERMERDKILRG